MTGMLSSTAENHLRLLRVLSILSWLLTVLLVQLACFLPLFDASPRVLLTAGDGHLNRAPPSKGLRWDVFHFAHIAQDGYVYEHEWAFFPGAAFILRIVTRLLSNLGVVYPLAWADGIIGLALAFCTRFSATTLYRLTLHHMHSPSLALLASLLSLLPSSPPTLRVAAYNEPFFTALSYKGMLSCARSEWIHAACYFTLASTFRSNGFLLGGFILWGLVIDPILDQKPVTLKQLTRACLLTALTFIPFIYQNLSAYSAFCLDAPTPAPWCARFPPLIYSHVQSKYWNVGFLRYWTPSQLPNFLISAPVLALLLTFTAHHLLHAFVPRALARLSPSLAKPPPAAPSSPFLLPALTPHALHALFLSLVLLFASHTQIVLRLAASLPITYWAAAWLVVEFPRAGKWWVGWSVVWGAVSCVLWAVFLPPA